MITISIFDQIGNFAENKDIARDIRIGTIEPVLAKQENIVIDFSGVEGATQSFIHALLADVIRTYGNDSLKYIQFKNCNQTIKEIISIVTDYIQESI